MAVTDLMISFPFVKADCGCILNFLWDSLLPPHTVKQLSVSLPMPDNSHISRNWNLRYI